MLDFKDLRCGTFEQYLFSSFLNCRIWPSGLKAKALFIKLFCFRKAEIVLLCPDKPFKSIIFDSKDLFELLVYCYIPTRHVMCIQERVLECFFSVHGVHTELSLSYTSACTRS